MTRRGRAGGSNGSRCGWRCAAVDWNARASGEHERGGDASCAIVRELVRTCGKAKCVRGTRSCARASLACIRGAIG